MTVERIGYGAGQKDFPQPNMLRVLVGEADVCEPRPRSATDRQPRTESIVLLETNLDNASGEAIGHAVERLWEAGALDVSLTADANEKRPAGRPRQRASAAGRRRPAGRQFFSPRRRRSACGARR